MKKIMLVLGLLSVNSVIMSQNFDLPAGPYQASCSGCDYREADYWTYRMTCICTNREGEKTRATIRFRKDNKKPIINENGELKIAN